MGGYRLLVILWNLLHISNEFIHSDTPVYRSKHPAGNFKNILSRHDRLAVMPKVSKNPLQPQDLKRLCDTLVAAIALLHKREDLEEFLQDFLTTMEWKMFAKRLAVAEMLLAGESYTTIIHTLKVSNDTIARMQE